MIETSETVKIGRLRTMLMRHTIVPGRDVRAATPRGAAYLRISPDQAVHLCPRRQNCSGHIAHQPATRKGCKSFRVKSGTGRLTVLSHVLMFHHDVKKKISRVR